MERFERAHGHGHGHEDGAGEGLSRHAALTVAIVAAFLAIATFLGNEAVKDAIQNQTKVSDADAQLQTFKTQVLIFNSDQLLLTLFANGTDQNLGKGAAAGLKELNTASKKIKPEQEKLSAVVKEKGKEVSDANDKHLLYELAAVLLQIAIVLASVSIIARRRFLLYGGQLLGAAGVVVLVVGFVH